MEPLKDIIGVEEASSLWDLSPGYIKNLCANDQVQCKKIGGTWVLDKNQSSPKKVKPSSLLEIQIDSKD